MRFDETDPPRVFQVGQSGEIALSDCGSLYLDPDEQITVRTEGESPSAFDVTRKNFGYYASNSLNGTLPRQGLRPALCRNDTHGLLYLLYVETGKEDLYKAYIASEGMSHLAWIEDIDPNSIPSSPV